MNDDDDFLRRLRVDPPPAFLARLKRTLDNQLPSPAAVPRRRSLLRALALGLLFSTSAFAIALLSVNGATETAHRLLSQLEHTIGIGKGDKPNAAAARDVGSNDATSSSPAAPGNANSQSISPDEPKTAADGSQPMSADQDADHGSSKSTQQPPVAYAPSARKEHPEEKTQSPAGSHTGPGIATIRSLFPAVKRLAATSSQLRVIQAADAKEAISELCAAAEADKITASMTAVARRMTPGELESCNRSVGSISEVRTGSQAVAVVRSKLYGAVNLSIRDLYLALAAEVPSPQNPLELIPNPYRTWNEVNSALVAVPIEFVGPPADSVTTMAFTDMLFKAGCESLPAVAQMKDGSQHQRVCQSFRTDGVYKEISENAFDLVQWLQANPNIFGLVGYTTYLRISQEREDLMLVSLGGLQPTSSNINTSAYPGSRPLYVYISTSRIDLLSASHFIRYYSFIGSPARGAWDTEGATFIPAEISTADVLHLQPLTPMDLK